MAQENARFGGLIRPEIRGLSPYNAGLTIAEVEARYHPPAIAKLGSNENPLGPSPKVQALFSGAHDLLRLYPDPSGRELAQEVAIEFDWPQDRIILGNGSEDLIGVICRTVLRPRDRVVTLYPSFPLHEDYATTMGASVERVEVTPSLEVDVDALVAAVATAPRLVMFANPLNPVGSWLTPEALQRVVNAVSPETLLVVDEAYAEYAAGDDYPSAATLLRDSGLHWVALRTFSKAYGLAGARLGFGLVSDPDLRGFLDRARTPFNANGIAQAAGLVARRDKDHLAKGIALALSERDRMAGFLSERQIRFAPSKGNFLFIDVKSDSVAFAEKLLEDGVIVKPWKQQGYTTFIRVSVGAPEENDLFMRSFEKATGLA
ncbi:histidinol-phosphate transaminase [Brucella anthropi]|jgi:histidinol-phosphate aminotransferase|uniref:Histidinol-phosphate aminotransferase n=2 Tax=Brucella anthropi TaxID=529 RepID=A0A6I0DNH8_BRUAN|nr:MULTISPECIES: histidinol-phosphate transaminase [Brucella/Ochrobactrum group]MCR5941911.1 histidinol-phosphate transaminase [Ochrobactrum sp. XJ1]QTN04993.1 histidinol-phosphate transaminase [Ochrobactrum sp. EEELCW01]KAB2740306.1 histidinol-phosphate transaminase [Brucella anthropi]KAB2757627.1 histidinol-phosphate transaminase [Brucella anthropi]KAB2766620.1 histidinol-phosphate transaminase [Brucella anthropi]